VLGAEVGTILALEEGVCIFFGEAGELGFFERDFIGVEREQGFGGTILECRDAFGHGIERAFWHRPWHGVDGDFFDLHVDGVCLLCGKTKRMTFMKIGDAP
ncbi:MAG: hypothetical protein KGQ89_04125, partial [Verrucomicrobia bacterium]|nr:hypothetical protein [Verrucomicrobiota bacterium]